MHQSDPEPRLIILRKSMNGETTEQRALTVAAEYCDEHFLLPPTAIMRTERGKPYFCGSLNLFFSASHSGDYFGIALHTRPVGMDIQQHRRRPSGITARFFHPDEQNAIDAGPESVFFDIWVKKESYVKYTGAGIAHGNLSGFSTTDDKIGDVFLHSFNLLKGYSIAVATETDRIPELLLRT